MQLMPPAVPIAPTTAPAIQVTLSRDRYWIKIDPKTGAPHMPTNVVATAEVRNWPEGVTPPSSYQWHVTLDWNYPKYPTHHDIGNRVFEQPGPLHIDFGNQIRGGLLTVAVSAMLNNRIIVGKAYALVVGENPTHAMVLHAFPRTRFGLIASKVGVAESDFQQFMPVCGPDPGGQPYMSRTNDIGIMQLNAPTGSVTSEDQIWDWRANVRRGMEELADKGRVTVLASRSAMGRDQLPDTGTEQFAYVNMLRLFVGLSALPPPVAPPFSDKPGSGIQPDDPDVDHLKLTQVERDMIRRYNGGSEYAYNITLRPDTPYPISMGWEIDPTRGGIRPNSGDPDYIHHVLRAQSGLTLPPPPKPKAKAPRRQRHSRHGRRRS
jgi:hypothetical protein